MTKIINVLKKYFIAYSLVLVLSKVTTNKESIDSLFVVTFDIKMIKKKMTKVRQTFQISVTEVNCACVIYA